MFTQYPTTNYNTIDRFFQYILKKSTAYNLPYAFCEQIGKEIRDISDEVPFEIPDSWEWVRLGGISYSIWAGRDKPDDFTKVADDKRKIPVVANGVTNDGILGYTSTATANADTITIAGRGTIGFSVYRTYEYCPIVRLIVIEQAKQIDPKYLQFYLMYMPETSVGSSIPQLTVPMIQPKLIPFPPIQEQHRIVTKIEELLPYIEKYVQAETQLTALNTSFPEALKKSILQEAIQGRLVPQDPNDEPASILLERIRAEKQALVKAGKIKKDKHESVIVTRDKIPYEIIDGKERCIADEVPFEIPEGWEWTRLGSISSKITDGEHKTPRRIPQYEGYYLLSARNILNGAIQLDDVDYVDKDEYTVISKRCNPKQNDILISCSGSVGRSCVVEDSNNYVMVRSAAMISPIFTSSKWIMFCIQSELIQEQIRSKTKTTAQSNLFQEAIRSLMLPFPPLAEQHRIVAQIEQLLPIINQISK